MSTRLAFVLALALGLVLSSCDDTPVDPKDQIDDTQVDETPDELDQLDEQETEEVETEVETIEELDEIEPDLGCEGQTRCSAIGNVETCFGEDWITTQVCDDGCEDGRCVLPMHPGGCGNPLPLTLGEEVEGSTDTDSALNTWRQACSNPSTGYGFSPTGPEQIYRLTLNKPTHVRFTLNPIDLGYYGMYVRADCADPGSEYIGSCSGNPDPTSSAVVEALLGLGTHDLIVDDFEQTQGPGAFRLIAESIPMPMCLSQVPQFIDLSSGKSIVQGDTNDGVGETTSNDYHCPNVGFTTVGRELSYVFTVNQSATVRATAQPIDPPDSMIAVYFRDDCDSRLSGQLACGYGKEGGAAIAEAQVQPGTYFVFVDDFGTSAGDGPQKFNLTLEIR